MKKTLPNKIVTNLVWDSRDHSTCGDSSPSASPIVLNGGAENKMPSRTFSGEKLHRSSPLVVYPHSPSSGSEASGSLSPFAAESYQRRMEFQPSTSQPRRPKAHPHRTRERAVIQRLEQGDAMRGLLNFDLERISRDFYSQRHPQLNLRIPSPMRVPENIYSDISSGHHSLYISSFVNLLTTTAGYHSCFILALIFKPAMQEKKVCLPERSTRPTSTSKSI